MESVIIITRRDCDLESLRRGIPLEYSVADAANDRIVIEHAGRRAYLGPDPHVPDELEPEEAARILNTIPEPKFYTLDFTDISLCKELLLVMVDRADVLVDNNHGVILSGSEFVRLLQSKPAWDWRRDLP